METENILDFEQRKWWGLKTTTEDNYTLLRIGPLQLWLHRLEGTWEIGQKRDNDPLANSLGHETISKDMISNPVSWNRFGIKGKNNQLHLTPATADRPVVSHLEDVFYLPPKEKTTLYIGTPLWFKIATEKPEKILLDQPFFKPSDTWFGPPTNDGELCYASRTPGRTTLEDVKYCPHRAITQVVFNNNTEQVHKIESFKLPVINFSLFASEHNHLWTQDVVFNLIGENEFAKMIIKKSKPAALEKAQLITPPREEASSPIPLRVLGFIYK